MNKAIFQYSLQGHSTEGHAFNKCVLRENFNYVNEKKFCKMAFGS